MSLGKFIKIFLIFGTIILSILGYWYYQKTLYSKEILKLEILGPERITAGEEFEYIVKYKNNGNFRLEDVTFLFQFPEQSFPSDEEYQSSLRVIRKLNPIYPGEEKIFRFRSRLFGKKDSVQTAYATVTFRPKGLKASYQAKTSFSTVIERLPMTFDFDLPSKIMPNKEFSFSINYFSNIDFPLADLRIKIDYPEGFQFLESHPQSIEDNEWVIPILNKTEGGRITVKGVITGETGQAKNFSATAGFWHGQRFILLKEISRVTVLTKPSIYISQFINKSPQYIARPGDLLHYEIFFRNIGEEPLENLSLLIKLEGEPFDLDTIIAEDGYFNPGDNFIIWDKRKVDTLQFLDVNEEGKAEFWINLKDGWLLNSNRGFNPIIKTKVNIGDLKEEFITKVSSKLDIEPQLIYEDETYFNNSGPYPPETGQLTTLTVVLKPKNYYNEVKEVKIRGLLPNYINLTGQIFPREANFAFDQESREFIWTVGDMEIGRGVMTPGPELAFQVEVRPAETPESFLEIIRNLQIEGDDQFVNLKIENKIGSLILNLENGSLEIKKPEE